MLFLLQGTISRMVQQDFWSHVCQWSPEDPLFFSPAGSDEHRGQDLNPKKSSLVLGHTARAAGPENQWPMRGIIQAVSFHAAEPNSALLYHTVPSYSNSHTDMYSSISTQAFLNNISLLIYPINYDFPSHLLHHETNIGFHFQIWNR